MNPYMGQGLLILKYLYLEGTTSVFFERLQTREQVNQLTAFIDASQVSHMVKVNVKVFRSEVSRFWSS